MIIAGASVVQPLHGPIPTLTESPTFNYGTNSESNPKDEHNLSPNRISNAILTMNPHPEAMIIVAETKCLSS